MCVHIWALSQTKAKVISNRMHKNNVAVPLFQFFSTVKLNDESNNVRSVYFSEKGIDSPVNLFFDL